ncbi:MarR family transcriptional regulator [Streptomyces mashuensis]|uniref:MarR family transcriptional regulator n=1 Tax=Streptomyces mashuensis TaxID=33904 RepID=A0A919B6S1_9ACTN|nr:MarR family transcriptional regulator [Streptomyces mashuensis]GHF59638.1 MarR family transcriptional regulator [Streptomyces mashuensis]
MSSRQDGNRDEKRDEAAVARFVERFAAELTAAGMQRMAARVFSALLASDAGSMTAAELAETLSISPAAVSGAVRYLTQTGMIGREREPGTRRDRYRLYDDVMATALTRRDQLLVRWEKQLREGADALGPHTPAGTRMTETADLFAFMQQELEETLLRWQERRAGARADD